MLSDGRNRYAYDDFGRLASTVTAEGDIQKNCYDAEGLRAEMEENGRLVQFLYNEDREVVAEKDYSGNLIRYIRGLGLISSDSENAKTYYHYVSDEQGSVSHIIRDEDKESGVSAQGREQDRILNQYEYDAFGNTISCKEQVENRFRYQGEQYDPITRQYYLRARYYNPVIGRFIQEDTYYGDGLNLYIYCRNNPILNHDPTGHGTKENSPYSRKEQQYIDVGADPDTARLAAECYPDANSKKSLYDKYKKQGYNAQDAKKLANYEIVHGEERAKNYAANNVKKSGPDYTATSPRDNVNTDWRTQERLNAQRKAGVGKSGLDSGLTQSKIDNIINTPKGSRPDPSSYLSQEYIDAHLAQFDGGVSVIQTEWAYRRYSEPNGFVGVPDDNSLFVMPKKYCNSVITRANGNISIIEKELGFPEGYFRDGGGLIRIDAPNTPELNIRIPSGNETGANKLWIPGGKTSGGVPEAITNTIPLKDTTITRLDVN